MEEAKKVLKQFSSLVYNLNGGLLKEAKLARFKEQILRIVKADCVCCLHFHPRIVAPMLIFKSDCKEINWKMLLRFLRSVKPMPDRGLKAGAVFGGRELSSLNFGEWQKFFLEVYHCFWDHSEPSYYLFGGIKLDHSLGLIGFKRALKERTDFGREEKEFLQEFCPHLENFLKFRCLTTLWQKQGGVRDYFRAKGLTPRESEVAVLVLKGMNISQLSKQLGISEQTVRDHLKKVYQKLDIHSKTELVCSFIRSWEEQINRLLEVSFSQEN